MLIPTKGRIVHYLSAGREVCAAIVTDVDQSTVPASPATEGVMIDLFVFPPGTGSFVMRKVPGVEAFVEGGPTQVWTWPPR